MNDSWGTGKKNTIQKDTTYHSRSDDKLSREPHSSARQFTQHSVVSSDTNNNVARVLLWLRVHSGRLSDRDR